MLATLLSAKAFWYLTRGTGLVALLLLTGSVALGVVTSVRWKSVRWPRFAVGSLHKNLTLVSVAFVVAHVLTTVLDGYAPVRLTDAVIPFVSRYRPVWLGLGAVAFDLLVALIVTSLLRVRLGYRMWRGIHWLAYASWPVAIVHALGTGSDPRAGFMVGVALLSIATVVAAVLARAAYGVDGARRVRVGAAAVALLAPTALVAWYESGPAQRGWARRAGTPATLLGQGRAVAVARRIAPRPGPVRLPSQPFTATLTGGRIAETRAGEGLLLVAITGRLSGRPGGAARIELVGQPLQGGVTMNESGVSYVPAGTRTVYTGAVTSLNGSQIEARVTAPGGHSLRLAFALNIDAAGKSVTGTVLGEPA